MKTLEYRFDNHDIARLVSGPSNAHFKLIERQLDVRIGHRDETVQVSGDAGRVAVAQKLIESVAARVKRGESFHHADLELSLRALTQGDDPSLKHLAVKSLIVNRAGKGIGPRGKAQQEYLNAIENYDIVFGIGPAGTGKTYLAVAAAVNALLQKRVRRIILARPAVEAGEKLGFLPGDLTEKVDPYLRPLYDALFDMLEPARVEELLEQKVIEVAPLAFMRGRTLHDAFAILDEAQNTSVEQMKMFLTRLGTHSKAVVTGDVTQIDLPAGKTSGLPHAQHVLQAVSGIAFCNFSDADVVRHSLVQDVIRAYQAASSS